MQLIKYLEILRFKEFLNAIRSSEDQEEKQRKHLLLLDFFRRGPAKAQGDSSALSGLIQSWHFAVQFNSEVVCSSVAAALASLLKIISSSLDFREHGISLCRELLQDENLGLFHRSLIAHIKKDYLIDPCLRLLTEIVQFDGGSVAKTIFHQRHTTYHRLDFFLSSKQNQGDDINQNRKPSLRRSATLYLIANLRLQSPRAKDYLISNKRISHALLANIAQDPPWMIQEVLSTLSTNVIEDKTVLLSTKDKLLSRETLSSLASLYSHPEGIGPQSDLSVKEFAHGFILSAYIPLIHNRVRKTASPPRGESDSEEEHQKSKDVRSRCSNSSESVTSILHTLKPYADVLQGDLLLEAFRLHPDLISEYFSKKSNFSFDPKLSTTWVGYANFILATIQLPLHNTVLLSNFQQQDQIGNFFNTVLPQPLTQKALTRCLNQGSKLITFLTINILNASFDKLKTFMHVLEKRHENLNFVRTKRELVKVLSTRFPEMRHVIAQFRSCPQEKHTFKESLTRLIASYYQFFPESVFDQTFDISTGLSDALKAYMNGDLSHDQRIFETLQLENMLLIALKSSDMDWWHVSGASTTDAVPKNNRLSPFTTLLKAYISHDGLGKSSQMRRILSTVTSGNIFIGFQGHHDALDILCLSLRISEMQDREEVYTFLDNCILRLVRRPVVYFVL